LDSKTRYQLLNIGNNVKLARKKQMLNSLANLQARL